MTKAELLRKHGNQDWETDKMSLHDIAILNVKVGQESLRLATLFGLTSSSLMMESGEATLLHNQNYINFINKNNKSFISASEVDEESFSVKSYYYGDVSDAVDEIFEDYPANLDGASGVTEFMSEQIEGIDIYQLFKMEKKDG